MCEHSTESNRLNVAKLEKLHNAPLKNRKVPFTVQLVENKFSNASKGISANDIDDVTWKAKKFEKYRYPKLQSFKSAYASDKRFLLLVGGRYVSYEWKYV